jgi:hypothetical protein
MKEGSDNFINYTNGSLSVVENTMVFLDVGKEIFKK